jgi:hypothetical protein
MFNTIKYPAMPVDTEFSSFSIRRNLYFKSREERFRNHQSRDVPTAEQQQPSTIRSQALARAETILTNHQDQPGRN